MLNNPIPCPCTVQLREFFQSPGYCFYKKCKECQTVSFVLLELVFDFITVTDQFCHISFDRHPCMRYLLSGFNHILCDCFPDAGNRNFDVACLCLMLGAGRLLWMWRFGLQGFCLTFRYSWCRFIT